VGAAISTPKAVLRVSFLRGLGLLRVDLRRTDLCLLVEEKKALGVAERVQKRRFERMQRMERMRGQRQQPAPSLTPIQHARAEVVF